ncbi:MAG: NAD(P)-dependent oxidoreductase [Oscillospiraceae bacterium]|nr:NAD(P)-dependent oxidoreductase [Oscillospiraceae bacterium]
MNLLITGAWQQAKDYITAIEQMGHEVVFMQQEKDTLPCDYEWVDGIIGNGIFLSHSIEKFTNLRYVQLTSAGFDRIPMEYIQVHRIEIHNARGIYSVPIAEFVISGVLQLYKQAVYFARNQKLHKWEKHRGLQELFEKKVCIIGCGSVGDECAKRFAAFGCHVVGVNPHPKDSGHYQKIIGLDEINAILPQMDILVLTLPLTEQTRRFMNAERLLLLNADALLVNVARGAVVETEALIQILPQIGGAVLDVFEEEPLEEDSPLWDMENVIITPHNSFVGEHSMNRLSEVILRNIRKYGEVS